MAQSKYSELKASSDTFQQELQYLDKTTAVLSRGADRVEELKSVDTSKDYRPSEGDLDRWRTTISRKRASLKADIGSLEQYADQAQYPYLSQLVPAMQISLQQEDVAWRTLQRYLEVQADSAQTAKTKEAAFQDFISALLNASQAASADAAIHRRVLDKVLLAMKSLDRDSAEIAAKLRKQRRARLLFIVLSIGGIASAGTCALGILDLKQRRNRPSSVVP